MTQKAKNWPTASCCGEPRVSPEVDACYDHATSCPSCQTQPMTPSQGEVCLWCKAALLRETDRQKRMAAPGNAAPLLVLPIASFLPRNG